MRVFISSLIRGLDAERDAAAVGIEVLRHVPGRAEDFGASSDSHRSSASPACGSAISRCILAEARRYEILRAPLGEHDQAAVIGLRLIQALGVQPQLRIARQVPPPLCLKDQVQLTRHRDLHIGEAAKLIMALEVDHGIT